VRARGVLFPFGCPPFDGGGSSARPRRRGKSGGDDSLDENNKTSRSSFLPFSIDNTHTRKQATTTEPPYTQQNTMETEVRRHLQRAGHRVGDGSLVTALADAAAAAGLPARDLADRYDAYLLNR
jgi:hypothetical protein